MKMLPQLDHGQSSQAKSTLHTRVELDGEPGTDKAWGAAGIVGTTGTTVPGLQ